MIVSSTSWNGAGERIYMQEFGTRDGLQADAAFVPTEEKISLVNALSQTGVAKFEVAAFVSPKATPALRDAEVVFREIYRKPGAVYSAPVPNLRGAERAIDASADELNLVMSASDSHNLSNLRMTWEQSFIAPESSALARQAKVAVNVSISRAFGCPMEGDVPAETVLDWCTRFVEEMGAHDVTLCDTTGMGCPGQVAMLTATFRERWPTTAVNLHFHNTRGMGLANVLTGIGSGADHFDASLGGTGDCPYAPGATGNICSEEIVHALELMGYDTGVDLDSMTNALKGLPALIGRDIPSQIVKAGSRLDVHHVSEDFDAIRKRAVSRTTK